MSNITKIAIKLKIRRKNNIFNMLFIFLIIAITVVVSTYAVSSYKYYKNDLTSDFFFRLLSVYNTDKDDYTIREELSSVQHIQNVSKLYFHRDMLYFPELESDKLNGVFEIYFANNETLPEIVLGTDFPDSDTENYLICPENFYPISPFSNSLNIYDKVDIHSLLNKNFTYNYASAFGTYNYDIDFKVVGFYKNSNVVKDETLCFTKESTIKEIIVNVNADNFTDSTDQISIEDDTTYVITIDDYKNIDYVKEKLTELGYGYDNISYVDYNFFETIQNNTHLILFINYVILFVVLLIIFFKQYSEDKNNYTLLNYLGYHKIDIKRMFIINNLISMLLMVLLSIIVCLLIVLITKLVISFYPFLFNKWTIYIDAKNICIVIALSIITYILGTISVIKSL